MMAWSGLYGKEQIIDVIKGYVEVNDEKESFKCVLSQQDYNIRILYNISKICVKTIQKVFHTIIDKDLKIKTWEVNKLMFLINCL